MKTLALLILVPVALVCIIGFGVGMAFLVGGMVTTLFHASDTGLAIFIFGSIAWVVWLAVKFFGGLARAYRG